MCKTKLKMCNILEHICTQYNCAKKWTILCAKVINTLCNKNINNTVQNFVQCCAIHEQNLCAIFFNFIVVQKNCAIFCENKCNTGNVGNTKTLLHSFVYIAQFCKQYWNILVCRWYILSYDPLLYSNWEPGGSPWHCCYYLKQLAGVKVLSQLYTTEAPWHDMPVLWLVTMLYSSMRKLLCSKAGVLYKGGAIQHKNLYSMLYANAIQHLRLRQHVI